MNQGLGSRVEDTGRVAPRAIPGTKEAELPNLGCLQKAGESWRPTPVTHIHHNTTEPWSDSLTANPGQRLTVPDSLTALTALSLTA